MSTALAEAAQTELDAIEAEGLTKSERRITSPQSAHITANGRPLLNLCANNYLGLADHPKLLDAAREALETHGFGMASVRFICGTQDLHKQLEARLASFLGMEDCILFPSCFDANGGLFEPLLGPEDAIISDALNHASIIDGVRLCKAQRFRYASNDMAALEEQLIAAKDARLKVIVTDGVFSMDGIIADLPGICDLAEKYGATVVVDDCHATGFLGQRGAGTPEATGTEGRVHILTGTLGKALGGASGGYVAGPKPIVELLRQRARPYLFSNAVAPAICAASLAALDLVENAHDLRAQLERNAQRFRAGMTDAGFELIPGHHPIIPVMLHDAPLAARFAEALLDEGLYVIAFSYPVVPKGQARIRTQMSAAHSDADINTAIAAFTKVGRDLGVI
ncbi:glycine C-acetyltransferase [Pontivivens ytuae]|uniref:2-amino-3-ketobutyrate coenzyme A ligase n=1 Tax=Pontivivens ytuae TaxID=2789856 RepID=A0A7S9LNH1_9RHOB|nr:glycine C-acetyltransferase [Pontivivens ytuae]QPH52334.1 glycine C-acetyltransferase [Pontivivens ytuae]